ncbi:MAG TPA: alpha/beta hydrolase, partial [Blastocatellia bacterium]|nr:alpha/beta hydrolase [Blastocatellia bacterium]
KEKIRNDSIQTQRKEWADYAKTLALAKGTKLQEETLGGVPCLWVHNEESKEDRVILYLHGGGLVDGSTLTHREMASRFSQITHLPVVLVDYRLLPEHPYPAPLEDVLSAYRALINQKKIEPKQIIFGGDSSGGGLVVATMMRLRDSNEPLPHRAFTISGVFDVSLSGDTPHTLDKADPILSHAVLKDWQAKYFSNSVELKSPFLSPLFGNLANLPPLLIQVGSDEVWLSDSIRLATKIKEAGGSIHLKVWDSMWHVWHMNAELPEAKWAIEEIRDFIFDEQIVENRQ